MPKQTKKVQYKDYAEYLESEKWEQVKDSYRAYAEDFNIELDVCYFCKSDKGIHHHHWTYEKDWNDDNCTNIIQVCSGCHTKLHNSLRHDSATYKTKEEYLSDAASVLIAASHLEGFAEGEDMQEKERTDESNAFIDHSNEDLFFIRNLKKENNILFEILYEILNTDGVKYQYISMPQDIHQIQKVDSLIEFVQLSFSHLKCIHNRDTFNQAIDILFNNPKDEF